MADDLQRLVVSLSADIKGFEREMRKANGVSAREARQVERNFIQMQRRLDVVGRGAAQAITRPLAGIAAALGTREIVRMTGEWTDLTSRVNLAAGGLEQGAVAMQRISEVARLTYSDLSQTAEGYLAFSTALGDLGLSMERQLDFVESVNNALVISGAKGEVAASVMDALSKAMALGELRGQNLNTVIAKGGRLATALAESMGVTTSELRRLGMDGKIGRAEILALTTQMEKLRKEAADMPATIQDGFMLLRNALLEYVGTGDTALGISARISEALVLIADNFEAVADTGLKLASILAAGLLGRSIAGMVVKLGDATQAVIAFGKAMRAAMAMGSVTTAIGGLSAAAGPLGMVLGGLLAGGVLLYSRRSQEAEKRTSDLREVLVELGLSVPEVAKEVDSLGKRIDQIGTPEQQEQIRKLRDGLEELKGRGDLTEWVFGDYSAFGKALADLKFIEGKWGSMGDTRDNKAALADLIAMAEAWQRGDQSAEALLGKIQEIQRLDLAPNTVTAVQGLKEVVVLAEQARIGLVAMGDTAEVDRLSESIADLQRQMRLAGLDEVVARSMDRIIEKFGDGEIAADQAAAAMVRLGETAPGFGAAFAQIGQMIVALASLKAQADSARAAMASLAIGNAPGDAGSKMRRSGMTVGQEEYFAEVRRWNALSSEQQSLEKSAERHFEAAAKANQAITREMAMQLAIEEAAADARRSAEGKVAGGRGGKGGGGSEAPSIFEDAARDLQTLEREITLIGKSTAEVARARAAWAMLDEARKQGIPISEELARRIDAEAAKIAELTAAQEHLTTISDRVQSALKGAFEGIFDDPKEALKDLGKQLLMLALQMQLVRSFPGVFGSGGTIPLLPGRASGGPVRAGSPYMVGERGPEPFIPAVNGRILSVSQAQAALRGGASGGTSVQIIDQRRADAPAVQTERQRGPDGREIIRVVVAEDIARGQYDKVMGGRFGARPQRVIR